MTHHTDLPAGVRGVVEPIIGEAARVVREALDGFDLRIKPDGSPVTSVDLAVERVIRSRLQAAFPDHGILGEEYGAHHADAEWIWLIDPIDGTRQFAAGLPGFGILLALCEGDAPRLGVICQPRLEDVYIGIQGQGSWLNGRPLRASRTATLDDAVVCFSDLDAFDDATRPAMDRLRSTTRWNVYDGGCLAFAALAAGRVSASVCAPNLDAHDFCALVPVVEGAGGVITDWRGNALTRRFKGAIVASCSSALHEQVLDCLAGNL